MLQGKRAQTDEIKRMVLDEISTLWIQHPDLRLIQHLLNATTGWAASGYFMEDVVFLRELKETYNGRRATPTEDSGEDPVLGL